MSERATTRRKDEVAAYALGALEPEEAAELERHLEGCDRMPCRAALAAAGGRPAAREGRAAVDAPSESCAPEIVEQVREEAAGARHRTRGGKIPSAAGGGSQGWPPVAAAGLAALRWPGSPATRSRRGLRRRRRRDDGCGGRGARGDREAGDREGDSATLKLANVSGDAAETGSSRPGCSARARSNRCRGLFVPDREGRATAMIPDMQRGGSGDGHRASQGRQRAPTSDRLVTARSSPARPGSQGAMAGG